MLTPMDDTLWHTHPTTFDHVGTSDPRFFDRYWFAASDPTGGGTLQLTLGTTKRQVAAKFAEEPLPVSSQRDLSAALSAVDLPLYFPVAIAVAHRASRFR